MRLSFALLICALALPSAASADVVVTNQGLAVTVQGDGAADHVAISRTDGELDVLVTELSGEDLVDSSELCTPQGDALRCADPDGNDATNLFVTVDGAGGDDHLSDTAAHFVETTGMFPPYVYVHLKGGAGNDDVRGNGETFAQGEEGDDRVVGRGNGTPGGPGDDVLVGIAGAENVWTQEPGADVYMATPRDIFNFEQAGPVSLSLDGLPNDGRAGEGDNIGSQARLVMGSQLGDHIDLSRAEVAGVEARGGDGDDVILGSGMRDDLFGGLGADRIDGAGGDDQLRVGEHDDVRGGAGRDALYTMEPYDSSETGGYQVSLDGVANDGDRVNGKTSNVRPDVEIIHGSRGPDRLTGAAEAQEIHGHGGDDEIEGGPGPDLLYGGAGADLMRGRDGGWDLIDCGDGADPSAEGDEGDQLAGCELFSLAPLPPPPPRPAPPAVDRRAPFTGIKSVRVRRPNTVRIRAFVDEDATLVAEVRSGGRRLGRRTIRWSRGTHAVRMTVSKRRLRRARVLTVTVVATDAAGNASKRTRRIRRR